MLLVLLRVFDLCFWCKDEDEVLSQQPVHRLGTLQPSRLLLPGAAPACPGSFQHNLICHEGNYLTQSLRYGRYYERRRIINPSSVYHYPAISRLQYLRFGPNIIFRVHPRVDPVHLTQQLAVNLR